MAEVIYINTEEDDKGSHNKFWSYDINGGTVTYKWGRVGRTPQSKVKSYSDRDHQKLIQEKLGKGYKPSSQQKLKDEVATAQELGTQYKIKTIKFVRRQDATSNTLHRLDRYDPKHHVLVEIINSWKKSVTRLLLSKDETLEVIGGVTEAGEMIGVNGLVQPMGAAHSFAGAVRNYLKRLSQAVTAIVKKVSFAALGRSLFDDDADDAEQNAGTISASPSYLEAIASIDSSGVDSSVISTFASMGRALEF
jgi:predicted DNA-binding WGR domain protein